MSFFVVDCEGLSLSTSCFKNSGGTPDVDGFCSLWGTPGLISFITCPSASIFWDVLVSASLFRFLLLVSILLFEGLVLIGYL